MANLLWGKVYYKDAFAGILQQEPGDKFIFTYDESYLKAFSPSISYTLPARAEPYISFHGLHPFFDNLVSEGWLEQAQSRLLGKRSVSRFELLLAFGFDCAGAVSVRDPEPAELTKILLDESDAKEIAVLTNRASLSGIQPKLAIVEEGGFFRPTHSHELSTHIAKFASPQHQDLIENEYLTTRAFQSLLGNDEVVKMDVKSLKGMDEPALLIKRFDRHQGERLHFEEFNQLLAYSSKHKYEGSYEEMATFIQKTNNCLPVQVYQLFKRIIVGLLLGNTDMHLKNFAMLHTPLGLRLTPSYDQVAAVLYSYKTIALKIGGAADLQWGLLKPKNITILGREFNLSFDAINMAMQEIGKNLEKTKDVISEADFSSEPLKQELIIMMEKRWNGTFASIGSK